MPYSLFLFERLGEGKGKPDVTQHIPRIHFVIEWMAGNAAKEQGCFTSASGTPNSQKCQGPACATFVSNSKLELRAFSTTGDSLSPTANHDTPRTAFSTPHSSLIKLDKTNTDLTHRSNVPPPPVSSPLLPKHPPAF